MYSHKQLYKITTVNDKKYYWESYYSSLSSVYREIMEKDIIEVEKIGKDRTSVICTKYIVSVEEF